LRTGQCRCATTTDTGSAIKLHLSIRWKLILSIVLPLIIITAVVMGFTLTRIFDFATLSIRKQQLGELNLNAERISAQFENLSQIATTTANILSLAGNITEDELYDLLAQSVGDTCRDEQNEDDQGAENVH